MTQIPSKLSLHFTQINFLSLLLLDRSKLPIQRSNLAKKFFKKVILKNLRIHRTGVPKISVKFRGKHLCQSPFLQKLQTSASETHQNGNFAQKYFNKSFRGGDRPKQICLHQSCLTNYPSTLLANPTFSVRGQMPCNRFGPINSFMLSTILPDYTSLEESELRPNRKNFLITTTWQSQIWYPLLLGLSTVGPLLLTRNTSLINPEGEFHTLITNRTLRLAVSTISGKDYLIRDFQKQLSNLLQVQDEKVQSQILIRPGECGLAGVINNRLMYTNAM